jgi:hypothetical protein
MIANTAFLAAVTMFLLSAWLAGELTLLAPYRATLFHLHGRFILAAMLLVFLNLCGCYYALARRLFLRDTGRKLTHLDRQLMASDGVREDLPSELWSARG